MATTRARPIALAIILGLVAVLGIVWLVRSATTDGQNAADEGAVSPAAASHGNDPDPDGGIGGTGTADDGGSSSGAASQGASAGGDTHRSGRRSIHVNGVHLDGNGSGDGCATIINKTSTPGTFNSVSFAVASGPAKPAVTSDNAAHCSADNPPCAGARVQEGNQCDAGAVLPPGVPNGTYVITTTVNFTYVCVDPANSPCDEVKDWGGSPPTPQDPVVISGSTSNNVPPVTIVVGGEPEDNPDEELTPAPDTPEDVPASPDTVSPDDEQPLPDVPDVADGAYGLEQG
ncbi:hypothetical protein SAMN06272735_0127 [Streptomyces sp. TLI_55]|uniref:hypothetical protein n=1 Tax=Streptomyces sp. TLI_55 TaxID=1938861 RepID=UPI000BCF9AD2|nr:hypothetical protein [Streptomyces sp. TLI_55]SNX55701.1 hypothetical protein SAMN06272735_0127 [Streptomyces sp. TLI_55]